MSLLRKNWPYALLLIIILLGTFLRFNDLSAVPPGIYPDEAKNANDAIQTLQSGEYQLFYPENNGREGLYIWLIALSFQFFGISIFSLKLVSALAGTLTIWATYLLTKEFLRFANQHTTFGNLKISQIATEAVSLLSAGFLATSFWHINFSRIGFRAILVPLILSLALFYTLRAFRTKQTLSYALAGIFWGLGFYTYIAFRLSYLILIVFFLLSFIFYLIHRKPRFTFEWIKIIFFQDKWWKVKFMGIVTFLVMAPLILYFVNNPEYFISRATSISVFEDPNPILSFFKSLTVHFRMLFFGGDLNWRHNFSGEAQLLWPLAILFIFGLWESLKELMQGWRRKNWTAVTSHLTLLASLGAMMLPAVLTIEGIPHALRAIGMMPFVFIYSAFGFLFLIRKLFKHKYHRAEIWPFGIGAVMIIILLLASFQFTHYFIDWGKNSEVEGAFAKNYVAIGEYFNSLGDFNQKYLIVNDGGAEVSYPDLILVEENENGTLPMSAQTTLFIQQINNTSLKTTTYIRSDELPVKAPLKSIFVPLRATEEIKNKLNSMYPGGTELEFEYFWVYAL